MNKQELIEKAVLAFEGRWLFPWKYLCTPSPTNSGYTPYSKFESIKDPNHVGPHWIVVCTINEFEATAKRMGYINGYKFGVEYPTNGKKPDLPDDLEIETLSNCGGNWHKSNAGRPDWRFDGGMGDIVKFRITDESYKPVEPAPAKPWFEAGELPPVGMVCEYAIDGGHWWPCEIRYIVGDEGVVMWVPHLEKEQYCSAHKVKFRPANPDRQQLIDIIESVGNQSNGALANAILAAGWGWLGK